jgi:CRISPR/Cas system endoribonuclease Cas6 (RAMP superfamily)
VADSSRLANLADMVIDMSAIRPVGQPITMTQAKGRGLRGHSGTVSMVWAPEPMAMTYKRRHNRQNLKPFPFSVIVRRAPRGLEAQMREWCEQWGERARGWENSGNIYYFTKKNHALMFILAFKGMDEPAR